MPVEWEKDVAVLDYPLPSRAALSGLLDELVGPARVAVPADIRDAMLEAARGLTWNEAENAFALALMRDRERVAAMPGTVQHEKTTRVRTSGLLDLVTPAETLDDVGGLAALKAWLGRQGALLAGAADALAWGFAPRDLPKGVLLLGVPGTGKSLAARAIAGTWRLPLLRLEMARVVGTLLTWLQERGRGRDGVPAPVFVVATANRVESLPPELFRPGRFDQVFFLDLPDPAEHTAGREPRGGARGAAQLGTHASPARERQPGRAGCRGRRAPPTAWLTLPRLPMPRRTRLPPRSARDGKTVPRLRRRLDAVTEAALIAELTQARTALVQAAARVPAIQEAGLRHWDPWIHGGPITATVRRSLLIGPAGPGRLRGCLRAWHDRMGCPREPRPQGA